MEKKRRPISVQFVRSHIVHLKSRSYLVAFVCTAAAADAAACINELSRVSTYQGIHEQCVTYQVHICVYCVHMYHTRRS